VAFDRAKAIPAITAARQKLLDWLDAKIASAPAEYQPGLQSVRDEIAGATDVLGDPVGEVLSALGQAFLSGDFGPATSNDADIA
jgi:hypothetical protein